MRTSSLGVIAATAVMSLSLAACGSNSKTDAGAAAGKATAKAKAATTGKAAAKAKIGVILPDTKSSARWETADAPLLKAAFAKAGVDAMIQNAQGDKTAFATIADQMLTSGATVLMIVNLDSGSGKAVLDKAKAQGVPTIDYDRLTLGGSAEYYVSFNNVTVGKLQGQGLVNCLTAQKVTKPVIAELNGSPTDNNATLFKQGYDSILKPKYASGDYVKGPDQSVPEWDNKQGGTIFEQMLQTNSKIAGVLAANDGLGNAALSILKKNNLNGKVPFTGQDATVQGLQNILNGDQCMTVFKDVKKEADAAASLAVGLAKGQKGTAPDVSIDPTTKRKVPSVLLQPQAITIKNVNDTITAGYVKKSELCAGSFAAKCTKAGIS